MPLRTTGEMEDDGAVQVAFSGSGGNSSGEFAALLRPTSLSSSRSSFLGSPRCILCKFIGMSFVFSVNYACVTAVLA